MITRRSLFGFAAAGTAAVIAPALPAPAPFDFCEHYFFSPPRAAIFGEWIELLKEAANNTYP